MNGFLLVALGGALGACARYGVGLAVTHHGGVEGFWATLIVNALGSSVMGALVAALSVRGSLPEQTLWLLVGVGFLGAFTTFSSFSKDAIVLLMAGDTWRATLYMALNMVLSLGGFAVFFAASRRLLA